MALATFTGRTTDPWVGLAAGVASAGVLTSAVVHLDLWFQGFRRDPTFGPLFLLTTVAGLLIGLGCVCWPSVLSLLAAVGFGVSTFAALITSATVGLFGLTETLSYWPQQLSLISEGLAAVAGVVGLLLIAHQARRATTPHTPSPPLDATNTCLHKSEGNSSLSPAK
jgi:hypothetical protein